MLLALFVTAVLLALRIWAASLIMADLPEPYGSLVLHVIGVGFVVALATTAGHFSTGLCATECRADQ